ncbi:hypothetical protein THRCLA_05149 [Thraustotheca clavata]|uniref:Protein kinase domain-containing protein n=1 Tax=Thraustotheca clavata TaxID=74557 RepID=A0A1V9ZWS3_9STRA|nr:hypothetical protein THRCLA_05149 [Thraustotheca clavata]
MFPFLSAKDKEKRLLQAAQDGNIHDIKKLLKKEVNINCKSEDGRSPVHFAAQNGYDSVINLLVNAGASSDLKTVYGWTPLHFAAMGQHENVVAGLINAGATVNAKNNDEWTALHWAARFGNDQITAKLINAGALVDAETNYGWTPLHFASKKQYDKVVDLLVNSGASLDIKDRDDWTPLHLASWNGNDTVVEILLNAGASLDAKTDNGKRPLDLAKDNCQTTTVSLIQSFFRNLTIEEEQDEPTRKTTITKCDSCKSELSTCQDSPSCISIPQPVPVCDSIYIPVAEQTILAQPICVENNEDCFCGVDPHLSDEGEDTLLHLSIKANLENAVDILLRKSSNSIYQRNQEGFTPLTLAIKLGHRKLANRIHSAMLRPIIDVPDSALVVDYRIYLGSGGFGSVYKGLLNGNVVAIKSAHLGKERALMQEISTMMKCRSPYIVDILAVSGRTTNEPKLAMELMDCGDLRAYLDDKRDSKPTYINVTPLEVAWVIANALADLHYTGIAHRNLKSQNILLSAKHYIKLGDLGISREYATSVTSTIAAPFWEAPEVLKSNDHYDYSADIYSFGVILTELDTLQLPYSDLKMSYSSILEQVVNGSLHPSLSENSEPWLKELADHCMTFKSSERPSAYEIVDYLQNVLHHPEEPTKLKIGKRHHHSQYEYNLSPIRIESSMNEGMMYAEKTPIKWTQISCKSCKAINHITSEVCIKCSKSLPHVVAKLAMILVRVKVAQRKGVEINSMVDCEFCLEDNPITSVDCEHCGNALPVLSNEERVAELAKRFEATVNLVAILTFAEMKHWIYLYKCIPA